ncbi:long-chain fatty acid--CoA ligase [Nocardia yamanashiensis]|uniref:long-chain-fatty-acid--CoA ligase n=1 Tax=Nocardia yamanashiensis TaxID=209247 RepID=UPI001E5EC2BA|nr:long-chain fatty acid--CoA ligase [Nocardia yamanashiensis]UGT40970.1 long-chain fatty acid--CoA ligase [Nocardia yamanashiensis]
MTATLSLASILAEPARRRPDHLALIEGAQRITFAQLWRQAREQAAALIELGVRPGDRVALMGPNTADFPRAYFAILAAGATVVPVHLLLTADEAEYVLRDSGAKLLVCHEMVTAVGTEAAARVGIPCVNPKELTAEPIPAFVTRGPLDTAVVFYTSGTTGRPKGAELSHLNMVMCATVNAFDANEVHRDDIALGALPLFHVFGQTVSMNSHWRVGATLVLLPRFDAAEAIRLMNAEGVNTFHGVPTMYLGLLEAARAAETLPKLKLCISGGAALPPSVLEEFERVYGAYILEGYGLSETSPTASVNQPELGPKAGTVGHPVWGVDVEIADPAVRDAIALLPVDTVGEVVVRGHNVFGGYTGKPEATAEVMTDGWFRTGDLGIKDADGYLRIVDRIKEMIIRGGFNVYPTEVEAALLRHPNIAQVAVIGVPDENYGEEILAVVVPSGPLRAEEVVDFAKEHVARYKYPRRVEFVTELPLGPAHKVLKRELKERYS